MQTFTIQLVAALAAVSATGAMDFTPNTVKSLEDGFPVTRTAFRDGSKQIFFKPANGWRMSGGGNEITFQPEGGIDAYARLGNSPVGASVPLEGHQLEIYRKAARSMLPKHADKVEVLSETTEAYPLDDWKSFEVWFEYDLRGTRSRCWVLFITMTPKRQVFYMVDGVKKDYEPVYTTARRMLGSWFEPPEGWPPPPR